MNAKAVEAGITAPHNGFDRLGADEELELIRHLGGFSDALQYCHQQWDPYPLVSYLLELATRFHKFYDVCRVISDDAELSAQRLGLANAAGIVLANGLVLLGISRPKSM